MPRRRIEQHCAFVFKLANGKITESREYMDTQLVKATFG
jgi:ketosteroid isomerase-like protein